MAVFEGWLYAATRNFTSGVQVYRSDGGTTWTKVNTNGFGDANNEGAYAMAVFGGRLHAAALNGTDGVEVWSSGNGTGWSQSNTSGFSSTANWGVYAMYADQAELIAGTFNYSGAELWRATQTLPWSEMSEIPSSNYGVGSMTAFNGMLYAGIHNSNGCEVWAYPLRFLFSDGFETGDLSRWSVAVP